MDPTRLAFPYTAHDTPELRARISRDLARIVERVTAEDKHLHALALTGGFSRGEGTVLHGAPLNDYDLVAFRTRPGGDARYARLHRELTHELGLDVDLMPVWTFRVPRLSPKLFWLDMRLGGRTLWGDETTLTRIPVQRARDLPRRREAARLLGNRAAGLLRAVPATDDAARLDADLQSTKAILAAMDAHLLVHDEYAPTLRQRLHATRDHPDHPHFARATAWKLDPTNPPPPWEDARDVLLRAVDATQAREQRDGITEILYHALRAHRLDWQPSRRVRLAAWDLLVHARWPEGPAGWGRAKGGWFAGRAGTLQ